MRVAYQNVYRNQTVIEGVNEEEVFQMLRELWQRSLAEFSYSDVMTAFEIWLNTGEPFPPTVVEMRRTVAKIKNPEMFVSAERMWEKVAAAVRKFGWCNEAKAMETLSDNAKRAIKNIGGWQKLCAAEGKEWDFRRKDFLEIYGEFDQKSQNQKLIPQHVIQRIQEQGLQREERIQSKLKQIEENKSNEL
jgi:hypothetical protein